jgi:ribosomal protein S18 acetylase RimI-like enzyme
MNVELRDLEASDADFLFKLYRDTRKEEIGGWGWTDEQIDAFIRMQFNARQQGYAAQFPDARDSIILIDGETAGRMLIAESPDEVRLVDIAVMSGWRGNGVGTILIGRLLESANGAGLPVRLHVATVNPARRLYERLGFATMGENGGYFQMEFNASH